MYVHRYYSNEQKKCQGQKMVGLHHNLRALPGNVLRLRGFHLTERIGLLN